jgi:hypothetical protein
VVGVENEWLEPSFWGLSPYPKILGNFNHVLEQATPNLYMQGGALWHTSPTDTTASSVRYTDFYQIILIKYKKLVFGQNLNLKN